MRPAAIRLTLGIDECHTAAIRPAPLRRQAGNKHAVLGNLTENGFAAKIKPHLANYGSRMPIVHLGGANAVAAETAAGVWAIVQADQAELIAPRRDRLTRLLRGQRGTEYAMGNPPKNAKIRKQIPKS